MGNLCYIANHTKKIRIGHGKFRELMFANYGDMLIHLLSHKAVPYVDNSKDPLNWVTDNIEVICDNDMKAWEKYYAYEDKTKYYTDVFEDSIGVNR